MSADGAKRRKTRKPPRKAKWADDLLTELLARMESGETITSITSDPRMPSHATILNWEDAGDERGLKITRAREVGYQSRADAIMAKVKDAADPVAARLQFDAERWYLGKMQPKRFGDAATLKLADANGEKIEMGDVERATRLAAIFAQVEKRAADAD
jgi:hypothetical protein